MNFYRYWWPGAEESATGHAAAMLSGLTLIAIGAAMVATVVLVPLGAVFTVLGVMLFGFGVFAHIQSPLKLTDLLDTLVGLTGAAIAMTFSLTVLAMAVGLVVTALYAFLQWVR